MAITHWRRVAEGVFGQPAEFHAVVVDGRQRVVQLFAARNHTLELRFRWRGAVGAP